MINIQEIMPFMKKGWVAMDEDDTWWWHKKEPSHTGEDHWYNDEDCVFDHQNKVNGIIKYYKRMGAFILRVDAGKIEIPYSVLDKDELKLEIWGNRYENEGRKNKWKK